MVDHLIAGIQQGTADEVERLGNPHGHEHFTLGIVADAELSLDIIDDAFPQAEQSEV